ncbi:hypothetical protein JRQ81_011121 [Phrynocephalus forsythii]|uniref:CBM21 domain-containing protein n=1 Tax=Phrynocephalus forsythii TaxID=171643 RepID=A0A9Q1AQU0_9SAUR|nr:hypothetical protein JRQ81_011121 [Phrynocephalus forsythii]
MSCGDLFQVFGPRATAPQAMRLCLSHPPPIRKLLDSYEELREGLGRQPLHPCLNNRCAAVESERPLDTAGKGCRSRKKKRVVFADMKGFSLTAVRIFSKIEEDLCDLHQALSHLTSFRRKLRSYWPETRKYLLDFPQPSADYRAFRHRLQSVSVCLENCLVQEGSLTGTVKVKNISYEKEVYVRVSFDAWKTFCDVRCHYMPSTALSRLANSTIKAAEPLGTSRAAALVLSRLQTWRRSENQTYW